MRYILLLLAALLSGVASAQYSLQPAFPNLPAFSAPLEMQTAGDGSDRIFIVEQKGKIYLFHNDPATSTKKVFLDLSGTVSQSLGETGLLGLAFHPDFKNNGYFYVNYTSSPGGQLTSFISRFHVDPSAPDTVLNATEQILLTLSQPYANHNGGHLAFGNDRYLYASFGDGGSGGDPLGNGQNRSVLLGKILRLDVDHEWNGKHYAPAAGNPFVDNMQGFLPEIYCWGMRNTWKFSFDRTTGKLWAGDVGQDRYEEVDTITNGGDYGWNKMEGFHCYPAGDFNCDSTGLIPPIWEYPHGSGNVSITGGYVYRGTSIPSLIGKYIYGDYGSGRVWALDATTSPATNQLLVDKQTPSLQLSSFGEDQDKQLYFVCYSTGRLFRLSSSEKVERANGSGILCSVTPNPFTGQISITYVSAKYSFEKITLSDVLGREVRVLLDEQQLPGLHNLEFDGSKLPAGTYILRLESGGRVISKKIIKE
ncbi:MAG: PQQ-dependent sugar dehydrogenase [Bacteroidota bacterium]|nr:PQQ-dependent sugar dehydrogenase [Bacteroidota bacterium]MDP4230501.1 PQQ-dependent sugar dehydrogenase [Bacteroidota bacterium]MDP4235729.1 PQQ-dependent sugar dehydrogenase [Bacteroidota bacterium]